MVEADTVRRLVATIEERLARLEAVAGTGIDEYESDQDLQDIVERNLEVAIQASIDLGLHLLADRPEAAPATNRQVFARLAEEGIVPRPLGQELERMAGFRNLLVHGYTELLAALVHENLGRLDDIRTYVGAVRDHLESEGTGV